MAEKIRINTKTLQRDTSSIQKQLGFVQKKVAAMQNDVAAMNKMWSGEANTAFNKSFNDDIKILQDLCKAIGEIIDYEATAKTEYEKCEAKVDSLIASMNV